MTIEQLHIELVKLEIPKWKYELYGGDPHEKLAIEKRKDKWGVYFGERGGMHKLETFDNESDACLHFLEVAKKYLIRK